MEEKCREAIMDQQQGLSGIIFLNEARLVVAIHIAFNAL